MLYGKITDRIESHLKSGSNKMLVVDGARQVGKSYIINCGHRYDSTEGHRCVPCKVCGGKGTIAR